MKMWWAGLLRWQARGVRDIGSHWQRREIAQECKEDDVKRRDVEVKGDVEDPKNQHDLHVCVCVCVCERERDGVCVGV